MMKAPRLATNPSANFVEAGKGGPLSLSFVLGVSPSSYQIEGAVQSDGRGHGFWDSYCNVAGRIGAPF